MTKAVATLAAHRRVLEWGRDEIRAAACAGTRSPDLVLHFNAAELVELAAALAVVEAALQEGENHADVR